MTLSASNITNSSASNSGITSSTSHTATFGWSATAGRTLLLIVNSTATVTTPAGWTADKSQVNNAGHYAFRKLAAGGETSQAFTISASRTACWAVLELSGLASTQPDVAGASTGSGTAATTRSTGTTGPTTQADVVVIGTWATSGATPPAVSSVTNSFVALLDSGATTSGSNDVRLQVYRLFPGAVGSYESTATFAASRASTGIVVAYRGATTAIAVGTATETDTAGALGRSKARPVGMTAEVSAALALVPSKRRLVGTTAESSTAFTVTASKRRPVGTAPETSEARPVIPRTPTVPGRLSTGTGPVGALAAATTPAGTLSAATSAAGSLSTSTGV